MGEMRAIGLNGRAIAVMGGDREELGEHVGSDGLRADLLSSTDDDGRPHWDGQGPFATSARPAPPEDATASQPSFAVAIGDVDDVAGWFVFLVDVHETWEGSRP